MKLTRKEMAWMIAGVLAIGMFLGAALGCFVYLRNAEAEGDMHYYCWIMCRPDSAVMIREKPGKGARVIDEVKLGRKLETDWKEHGKWLHVINLASESGEGWVYGGYVAVSEPVIINAEREIVGGGRVRIREWMDGKFKAWAAEGSRVTVYAAADGWACTDRGYIQNRYIGGAE